MSQPAVVPNQPLPDLDQWDDFLEGRYREGKSEEEFRVYDATATPGVAEFYRLNHQGQTVAYVLAKEKQYFGLNKGRRPSGKRPSSSTPSSTTATPTPTSPRSSTCSRPPRPSAATATLAGWCSPASSTTSASVSASMASRNGASSATPSPSAAPGRRTSSFPNTSPTIPTARPRVSDQVRNLRAQLRPRKSCTCRSATMATSPKS